MSYFKGEESEFSLIKACSSELGSFNCIRLLITEVLAILLLIQMIVLLVQMKRCYNVMNSDILMIYISFFQCACQMTIAFYKPYLSLLYLGLFIEILQFTYMGHFMGVLIYTMNQEEDKIDSRLKHYSRGIVTIQSVCFIMGLCFGQCRLIKDYPMLAMQSILIVQFIVFMVRTYRIISQLNSHIKGEYQFQNSQFYKMQRTNVVKISVYYIVSVSFHLFWNVFFEFGMDHEKACISDNLLDDSIAVFQIFLFVKQCLYMLPFLFLGFVFRLSLPPKGSSVMKINPKSSMHEAFFAQQKKKSLIFENTFASIDQLGDQ